MGVGVDALRDRGMTWVLSRLRLRIVRMPVTGERLAIRTWHSGFDRLFSLRDFSVVDADEVQIVGAVSAWVMLDLRARRPVRPASAFTPHDTSRIPRVFSTDLGKLPGCAGRGEEAGISVRWSDLDLNGHVNNSRYAEWVVEGASALCRDGEVLVGMDIDYLAETFHPDAVVVRSLREPRTEGLVNHSIERCSDRAEAVRARTEWKVR